MASVNSVILVGNVGKEPELKTLGSGTQVCSFSLATSYKQSGGQEKTSWHNITSWNKTAESCAKYLKKGSKACVEGRIEYREYEKDGVKRYATDIVADRVTFLSSVAKHDDSVDIPF